MTVENNRKNECCGCGACVDICPVNALDMSKDQYGFWYPNINGEKCINCGICRKVCPYCTPSRRENSPLQTFAALNKSTEDVLHSSSGGIFVCLARRILEKNGIVYGCSIDTEFQVKHIRVENISELYRLQKSKYIQSNTAGIYAEVKQDLKNGKRVLFSGTPCQVTALYSFLQFQNYDNLFTVDIVCHGVPSQELFDDYMQHFQKRNGKIEAYEFRAKQKAQNGMNWYFAFVKNKKKIFRNWPEDSFNFLYMKGLCYRESCYECKFAKKERRSDITLCDYWGWEFYHRKDFLENSSVSGVIVNSLKGQQMLKTVTDLLVIYPTQYENLEKHNYCLTGGILKRKDRDLVLKIWKERGYSYLDKQFHIKMRRTILKYMLLRQIPENIKQILRRIKNEN